MKNQIVTTIKQCKSEKELMELWKSGIPNWASLLSAKELQEVIRTKDEKKSRLQHKAERKLPPEVASSPSHGHYQIKECPACHRLKFWRLRGADRWICSLCNPPVGNIDIEWIDLSRFYYDRI